MSQDTMTVANRLVELCRAGGFMEAVEELYADDAVQIEALDMPGPMPKVTQGKAALVESHKQFSQSVDVHNVDVGEPYPHEDRFIVSMVMDHTPKQGPMAGKRTEAKEMCLYTVKDGKISKAEFFYAE